MNMRSIDGYLQDVREHRGALFPIVHRLREIALGSGVSITETVKYGGLLFSSSRAFCGVFAYRSHVSLEFSEGASLADPAGALEGDGKHRRHIKIANLSDIEDKQAVFYIAIAREAADDREQSPSVNQ